MHDRVSAFVQQLPTVLFSMVDPWPCTNFGSSPRLLSPPHRISASAPAPSIALISLEADANSQQAKPLTNQD